MIETDPEGDGEGVLVTMASQGPGRDRPALAARLGLRQDQVRLDVQMAGGSFGRRSQHDAHFPTEVADVFRSQPAASGGVRPTKVLWTREDDLRGGYYRPMVVHRLRGGLSRSGELVGWEQAIAAQSFRADAARAGRLGAAEDGPAPEEDGPAPEEDGLVLEEDGPAPEADGPAPEADGPANAEEDSPWVSSRARLSATSTCPPASRRSCGSRVSASSRVSMRRSSESVSGSSRAAGAAAAAASSSGASTTHARRPQRGGGATESGAPLAPARAGDREW